MGTRVPVTAVFAALVLAVASAFAGDATCPRAFAFESALKVPDLAGLQSRFDALLSGLCRCDDSALLRELVPNLPANQAELSCPGPLWVVAVKRERSDLVSIVLSLHDGGAKDDPESRVVFGSYVDQQWFFSWPTPFGPELHQ